MKSELVELEIDNDQGKSQRYFTYDGYYEEKDRRRIRQYKRKLEKRNFTYAAFTGLLAFYVSKKMEMPMLYYQHNRIPTKGLLSGAVGFGVGYLLFDFIGTNQLAELEKDVAQNSKNLPLWKHRHLAVNPDRVYFQLVDSKDNQISIFHSGLTPEAAARLIPDKIIGTVPEKPSKANPDRH